VQQYNCEAAVEAGRENDLEMMRVAKGSLRRRGESHHLSDQSSDAASMLEEAFTLITSPTSYLPKYDERVPTCWQLGFAGHDFSASAWKAKGNDCFKYHAAIEQ
jgi:hypothetical protein